MVSSIQKLVLSISDIDNKIKGDINNNILNHLTKYLNDKNALIVALNKILPSQISPDDIDDLTKLLKLERELVDLVKKKLAELREQKERDENILKSLKNYLKVTQKLTDNLNLEG